MTKAIEAAATGRDGKKAPRDTAAVFALAMVLAALAGFVDATGYIHFHHLFVSFMSGNSTQAMVAAAQDDMSQARSSSRAPSSCSSLGVTIGETVVASLSTRWGRSACSYACLRCFLMPRWPRSQLGLERKLDLPPRWRLPWACRTPPCTRPRVSA